MHIHASTLSVKIKANVHILAIRPEYQRSFDVIHLYTNTILYLEMYVCTSGTRNGFKLNLSGRI